MTFVVIEVGTELYHEARRLREQVLRAPLGLSLTGKDLAMDSACFHLGIGDGSRLLAVLLLQPANAREVQMRQVAVWPEVQRSGIGSFLLNAAERFSKDCGYRTVFAHARVSALRFYEKRGYVPSGPEFFESTIGHRLVVKVL